PVVSFIDESKADVSGITADDFTVVYADNNKVTKEAKATVTLKDSVKNYTFQEGESELTDVKSTTAKFEIVDNSVETPDKDNTDNFKIEKAKLSNTESKDGLKSGYDKTSGKLVTEVIPSVDVTSIQVKGSRTSEAWDAATIDKIYDSSKARKDITDEFDLTNLKKEVVSKDNDDYGQITVKAKASSDLYEGSYTYEYKFTEDCNGEHVWKKDIIKAADFDHVGQYRYICEKCGEEASGTIKVDGKDVIVADGNRYTIQKLDAGTDDDYIRFTLNNGKAESLNKSIAYRGVAVTAEDVKVQLTDGTVIAQKVFNADDAVNKVEHKNNIFTVTLSNNNAAGTAKLTIKFTDEIPEYEGATYTTEFKITPAVTDVEAPEATTDRGTYSEYAYWSYGTKVTLQTKTKDAKILYTISTKDSEAVDISDEDKYKAALAAKKDIKTYDGNPIELTEDYVNTDRVVIYAVAVKGDGIKCAPNAFVFNMKSKAADMGDVVEDDLYDRNDDGKCDGEDIPDGLWISVQETAGIT
ncbi:MAG: hypothetical protein II833_01710, partial [Pseudobutyrivibrio sp.]|nr:hypothetical protein [Pseudobutyrivibrio sp.]